MRRGLLALFGTSPDNPISDGYADLAVGAGGGD
jgi:hypothetical protein